MGNMPLNENGEPLLVPDSLVSIVHDSRTGEPSGISWPLGCWKKVLRLLAFAEWNDRATAETQEATTCGPFKHEADRWSDEEYCKRHAQERDEAVKNAEVWRTFNAGG